MTGHDLFAIIIRYGNIVEFPVINSHKNNHMNGTIKTLVKARKFGFIARDGQEAGAKDLFFHAEDLDGVTFEELKAEDKENGIEGDRVSFEEVAGEKGPAAKNVKRE